MSKTIAIPDLQRSTTVADQALTTAQGLAAQLLAVQVATPEQAQWATNVAHQVREQQRGLENERDAIAKPLRKLATQHTAKWKPSIDLLGQVITHLKGQVLAFQAAQRQRQAQALCQATTQAEVAQAVATLAPAPAGLQERVAWAWEVTDANQIPREYFVLDTERLNKLAREHKDKLAIPGIRPVRNVTGVLR